MLRAAILVVASLGWLGCGGDDSAGPVDSMAPVVTHDVSSQVIEALRAETLTVEDLQAYYEANRGILGDNIEQAESRHGVSGPAALAAALHPRYVENRDAIVSSYDHFPDGRDQIAAQLGGFFGTDLAAVQVFPLLGLYANGGWASGGSVAIALEVVPEEFVGALLAHEWAHAIADQPYGRVCDQMYREGFATYVSMMAAPGHPEEMYFQLPRSAFEEYLVWIGDQRERILGDLDQTVPVGGAQHSFYFSYSRSEMPNLGYVIGYLYVQSLHETYSLAELRTFGVTDEMLPGLQSFLLNY